MFDIRKACRWKLPKVSYTNFRKQYPNMGKNCFTKWFSFQRFWSGRIWNISVKHHQVSLDFRLSWVDDMVFPNATKADRKAVDDAIKANAERTNEGPAI
jgi:hypothetical protein